MQRQSLGSPVSKHHGHGGAAKDDTLIVEEPKQRDRDDNYCEDDVEHKATKPHRVSLPLSPPQRPEKFVHVIPVLTFLCFLILYLSSHTPSQSDLAQFNGFQLPAKHLDSAEINDVGRFNEIKRAMFWRSEASATCKRLKNAPRNPAPTEKSLISRPHFVPVSHVRLSG